MGNYRKNGATRTDLNEAGLGGNAGVLRVREGDGEGVGGVGLGILGQAEQGAHHEADLGFLRAAKARMAAPRADPRVMAV